MHTKRLVYLAVPYNHEDPEVREYRFKAVNKAACRLMQEGHIVFSPITHGHPIAKEGDLPVDWEYWQNHCMAFLTVSHKFIVLRLDGWEQSKGVQGELKIAESLGIAIEYIDA